MTKNRFRWILILSIVWAILGIGAAQAGEDRLPGPLREYLATVDAQAEGELTGTDLAIVAGALVMLVVYVASFIGLLRFARWSRPLSIGVTVVGTLTMPLLGPTVEPTAATGMFYLSSMFYGAAIAAAYLPPAADWFRASASRP